MNEEVEFQDVEIIEECDEEACQDGKKSSAGESVSKAINSFMETLESALSGRGNSVMVRVNDEALAKLDMLIAAGICKSRSESAAFLLQRGIEGSAKLFDRIESVTSKITKMREDLLASVQDIGK
ncbi:MAG: hypothetical protein JXA89_21335 [Anaerolineae bacterium]|nr:hypothetical protein [Anaerolineae bacterium]